MKEHHQAYVAAVLTIGEFGGASWLVIHDGHFFAIYLAFTYLMRETAGGKHYHDVITKYFNKLRREKAAYDKAEVSRPAMLHDTSHNPF